METIICESELDSSEIAIPIPMPIGLSGIKIRIQYRSPLDIHSRIQYWVVQRKRREKLGSYKTLGRKLRSLPDKEKKLELLTWLGKILGSSPDKGKGDEGEAEADCAGAGLQQLKADAESDHEPWEGRIVKINAVDDVQKLSIWRKNEDLKDEDPWSRERDDLRKVLDKIVRSNCTKKI